MENVVLTWGRERGAEVNYQTRCQSLVNYLKFDFMNHKLELNLGNRVGLKSGIIVTF